MFLLAATYGAYKFYCHVTRWKLDIGAGSNPLDVNRQTDGSLDDFIKRFEVGEITVSGSTVSLSGIHRFTLKFWHTIRHTYRKVGGSIDTVDTIQLLLKISKSQAR